MEKRKVSIIIPNYNGKNLLSKNLPSVIKNSPNCEIIVVDDASTDDSVPFIKKKYRRIKLIHLKKNCGFAVAVNTGVSKSNGDYVLLLNTDVSPRPNYLKNSLSHFENTKLFAVGLLDYSHEKGRVIPRGRGGARFKRGLIEHYPAFIEKGINFWVSGGSGLFDKKKFIQLGGFDSLYKPFYWEDIDLSYRAWKSGYTCLFEPFSKVDHFHEEGAIATHNKNSYIKIVSTKNQILFVWKNISDTRLVLQHFLWLPYHLINSLFHANLNFLLGLILATASLPGLILMSDHDNNYRLTDQEVFDEFDK